MITRLLIMGAVGFISFTVFAGEEIDDVSSLANVQNLIMADNPRKDRRDDRQDDRDDKQDCRQEEGRVGDDKRECKQEERGDGDEEEDEGQGEKDGADA